MASGWTTSFSITPVIRAKAKSSAMVASGMVTRSTAE